MSGAHANGGKEFLGDRLYVWSGIATGGNPSRTMEIYDPGSNTWNPGASVTSARHGLTSFVLDGRIYSVGGEGPGYGEFNRDVYRYDPADPLTYQWRLNGASLSDGSRIVGVTATR